MKFPSFHLKLKIFWNLYLVFSFCYACGQPTVLFLCSYYIRVSHKCDNHHNKVLFKDKWDVVQCVIEKNDLTLPSEYVNMHQPRTVLSSRLRTSKDCLSDYRDTLLSSLQGTQCPSSMLSHCLRTESSSSVCVCMCVREIEKAVCVQKKHCLYLSEAPWADKGGCLCFAPTAPSSSLSVSISFSNSGRCWLSGTKWKVLVWLLHSDLKHSPLFEPKLKHYFVLINVKLAGTHYKDVCTKDFSEERELMCANICHFDCCGA